MSKKLNGIMLKKKKKIQHYSAVMGLMFGVGFLPNAANASDQDLTYLEEMGKRLFFEKISLSRNMSCSTCHTADTGGTNGDSDTNLVQVAVTGSDGVQVGNLKPPTNKYAQFLNEVGDPEGLKLFDVACSGFAPAPCGGAFWNGRAEGDLIETVHNIDVFAGLNSKYETMYKKYLGPVADQAHASPFINPLEQAKDDKFKVCTQVRGTTWGRQLYQYAWGEHLYCSYSQVDEIFARFAVALSAWQMSSDNNRFDSKRDIALKHDEDGLFDLDGFTDQENDGHDLFYGQARCFFCHQSGNDQGVGKFERYTNDFYFNIGVPRNHEIPNDPEPDLGLFATTSQNNHRGEHKVPTLRNVDKRPYPSFVKAYTHNGWFKSLEQIVHFYNTATVKATCSNEYITAEQAIAENCWPAPEVNENLAGFAVGNLRLSADDEAALVSYLKTLTDTTSVEPPSVYLPYTYDKSRLDHNDEESYEQEAPIYNYRESIRSRYMR
ncbi:methylamine utilization protein [Photobacterium frigidiphilum]|uniref:cytochrome-c peroxidase n=1 Tax=Photobacterium frigidiphilum TaxID=264736 RepID=UPI003D0CC7A7